LLDGFIAGLLCFSILLTLNAGQRGIEIESMTDDGIISEWMQILRSI